jgi:hypothetical protein
LPEHRSWRREGGRLAGRTVALPLKTRVVSISVVEV